MKVLVIGSGGREHAITYALNKSKKVNEIHALPGNPGIAQIAKCHKVSVEDNEAILKVVEENNIDYVVVGPEVPLCNGIVDLLEDNGYKVFGPRKKAATFEGSKAFTKEFLIKHNIPTARYIEVNSYDEGVLALDKFNYPVVVKADGLAAGKGVVICENKEVAIKTIKDMMINNLLADAGHKVILEEFLTGFECSLLCFVDNNNIIPMVSAKDHKQLLDGNIGPNTGGMGTVSPNPFLFDLNDILEKEILKPILNGFKNDNIDYRGVLFIGLMIENNKPKVLEFNVRFGDPETQSILLRLDSDLFEIMNAVSENKLSEINIKWKKEHAGCLVLASKGYPGKYEKNLEIRGIENVGEDIIVFHAGTSIKDNKLVTSGGRVLNICALGNSLEEIRSKLYKAAEIIDFSGKQYRKDIGLM